METYTKAEILAMYRREALETGVVGSAQGYAEDMFMVDTDEGNWVKVGRRWAAAGQLEGWA